MAVPSALSALADIYDMIPFGFKLAGHCLIVASWFRQPFLRERYMLSYWVGLMGGFGGGLLTAFLLQDPKRFGISLFADNTMGLTWTICWWLMNYSPLDVVYRVHDFLPIRMVTKALMNSLRAGIIAARVAVVVELFPGVIVAPLMIGTLAASGGKLCVDTIMQLVGPKPSGAPEIAEPGFALRSGMTGTMIYWLSVNVLGLLTPREGAALIVTIFVAHGIAADLLQRPLDFTYPIACVLHTILLVPMPGGQASKSASKAISNAPVSKVAAALKVVAKPAGSVSGRSDAKKTK